MSTKPTEPAVPSLVTAGMDQTQQAPHTIRPVAGISVLPSFAVSSLRHADAPGLLLQTVVTLGNKVPDGQIIEAVAIPWFEIVRLISKDPNALHQIDWRKWEEIIGGAYRALQYEVVMTPRSGDLGRDLIATSTDGFAIKIIDQVKAYAPGNLVSANDVRAMSGVLSADRNISKGYVTTTSGFAPGILTDPTIQPFMPYRLELRSGPDLVKWLTDIANKKT
jgi:restriction system protein